MSSAKQLNMFEENKLQALPEDDLPEFGFTREIRGTLHIVPSNGQMLWKRFQEEVFLRYSLPARFYLDEVIEKLQQRHIDYFKRLREQQRRLREQ